uniref:Kinesin motor domain-containing protein n=1 Tax=Macrostomum lignano TaxID=282301 RepID=A0A1I8JRG8_9PLAT
MFDGTVADLVKQLLQGHSGLVFSYGVTSAGKTHTIQGSGDQPGILPRALKSLFDNIGDRLLSTPAQPGCLFRPDSFSQAVQLSRGDAEAAFKKTKALLQSYEAGEAVATAWCNNSRDSVIFDSRLSSDAAVDSSTTCESDSEVIGDASSVPSSQKRFCVWVSYAEIYNEVVYDLLEPIVQRGRKPSRTALDDACRLVLLGKQNQSVAATVLNQQSSRSHSLFAVRLVTCLDKEAPNFGLVSSLTFCDLAGSESQRTARYGANIGANDRAREACSINSSLLTLRRCIETLQHNQQNPKSARLVPFRESKLTQLIQPYFSGSGRATMIVNISRCANSDGEDEQQYEVTYVDANEFEMADIAQCSKEEMLKLIGDLRQTVQQQEEEMEEREMRIRRELIAERDRLMSEVEERFEQQLQEQKELQEERHDTRLREYLDTSQRISDNLKKRMVEAHKRKLAELQAKIDRLEEQLGEARSEAEQQDEQLENLNNKVEKLEMELAAAQSVSTKEAIEAEVNIRVRRIGDMHRRLAESADISSLARSHPPPPHQSAPNDSFLVHELEAELVEEQENRERQVGAMTATLACSQEMLDGLRMERELLAEELKTARLTVEEQLVQKLREEMADSKAKDAKLEEMNEQVLRISSQAEAQLPAVKCFFVSERLLQLNQQLLELKDQLESSQSGVDASSKSSDLQRMSSCWSFQRRLDEAESEAENQLKQVEKLRQSEAKLESISAESSAKDEQLLELQRRLDEAESEAENQLKQVEKLRQSEAKLESISAESSAKDEQLLELRRRLDEAESEAENQLK